MHGLTQEHARLALSDGWSKETLKALHWCVKGVTADAPDAVRMSVRYMAPFAFLLCGRLVYRGATERQIAQTFSDELSGPAVAYTDGSGTTKVKPAGIGVVLYRPDDAPQLIAENIGPGTNNRAELCAIWRALRAVPAIDHPIHIYSDSEYAIGALTQDWQRNHNAKLIECIRRDLALREGVRIEHVDGHDGNEGNEVADRLASIGRKLITEVTEYPDG